MKKDKDNDNATKKNGSTGSFLVGVLVGSLASAVTLQLMARQTLQKAHDRIAKEAVLHPKH